MNLYRRRPGHPPGRVGFGSGQKKPGVFSSGPCPTRPGGRAVKLSPHPTRQPVGSGRVRVGSGRAYVKCRVPSGFSGFGSKFLARARPVSHTGSKILTRARPSNSSGRVGSGYFRAGWVGSVGSGSPCPGLLMKASSLFFLRFCLVLKNFLHYLSHRIFGYIHEALNTVEKVTNYTV